MDTTVNTTLSPIASIPFVGIYQLAPSATNVNGYFLQVTPVGGGARSVRVSEKTQNSVYLAFSPNPSVDRLYESLTYGKNQPWENTIMVQVKSHQSWPIPMPAAISSTRLTYKFKCSLMTKRSCTGKSKRNWRYERFSGYATRRTNCEYDYYFAAPFICTESQQTFIFTVSLHS